MSYIIIGGGISGLYCAYSLNKKFGITDIIILEKNDRLGGRIQTLYTDGMFLEMGAGGIMDSQPNVMHLIKELGLEDQLLKGSNGRSLVSTITVPTSEYIQNNSINEAVPTIYKIKSIIDIFDTDFYDIMDKLNDRLLDESFYQTAISYNLFNLIEKYYGIEKAEQLMYQFGYHADFYEQNSVEALAMFKKEFSPTAKFHRINGGMIQIINKLADYVTSKNIKIMLNTKCLDITRSGDKYECILNEAQKIQANNIIFAIPKANILRIRYLDKVFDILNAVINKPLIRIYAFFPLVDGKVWFDKIDALLTTKTLMNQIVPMDKTKGLMMIYCDGQNAITWNSIRDHGQIERELMFQLTKLFSDMIIPNPIQIIVSYHESATHIWKPSVNPLIMYEEIVRPIPNENIFIVGEAYSLNQQWSAGAISSVDHLMALLNKN